MKIVTPRMHVLKLTCAIVIVAGCLRPQSWTSLPKRIAYNIYRLYVFSMLYIFSMTQILDMVLVIDNPDDFTDNLNMMTTATSAFCKTFLMWINYENVAALINSLNEEPFNPLDRSEMEIRQKFDQIIRNNTLRYMILIESTCSFIALASLFTDFRHRTLTYREWVPYNYSSYMIFCFTYAQQMVTTFHCATVNIACDMLLCGLLMHICCQFEILEYRLNKISNDQITIGYCICHHNRIYKFAQLVNTRFNKIIGIQFIASGIVICSNLYQLTNPSSNTNPVLLIMYTSCMLTQIFIYCWFGNRVKIKSLQLSDSVYQMNWSALNNNVKKSLLIIMNRAEVPIEISTAYIISMNLDSFVTLLKTSYSVYNLLVRMQEKQ